MDNNKKILTLNLKRKYFEEIKSGVKTEEFREYKDFWRKRLENRNYDIIAIKLGYPKKGFDQDKVIYFKWNGYKEKDITHEIFDDKLLKVFAIDLSERID